jgi:hypothetical protein
MMVVVVLYDDEVFLCNHQVFPIDLTEDFWSEHIGGRPSGIEAGLKEHESIHPRTDHIDVMGDQEHGEPKFVVQMLDQLNHIMLSSNVQSCGRFVEQENFGLLS